MRTQTRIPAVAAVLLFGLALLAPVAQVSGADKNASIALNSDPHLVGWWRFDEITGNTAADASGKGHPAILGNDLSFTTVSAPGQAGAALKLDGSKEGAMVTGFKGVTGPRPRTIAAWIKTAEASGEIISWGEEDSSKLWTFGYIRKRIGVTPKGGYLYMKAETHDNAWHHVAVVVTMTEGDAPTFSNHTKLYLDGGQAEIHDIGLLDLYPIDTGDKLDVRIGRKFKGLLADLRLYDRALSEEEIKALGKSAGPPAAARP